MRISKRNALKWLPCLALAGAITIHSCRTHFKVAKENYKRIETPSTPEKGKNLATNVCGGCHNNHDLHKFVGQQMHDLPKYLGKVYSANLTHSKRYGIPDHYTDAQLAYFIKTGIKPNGRFIPYMIRPTMADEDVSDIITYLRSDDAPLEPGDTLIGKTHLSILGKMAMHFQKPTPYIEGIKRPAEDNAVASGRYLVDILGCYHCHSKGVLSLKYTHPEQSKHYMQGGMKFKNLQGKRVRGANLTPDNETGIGKYSKADFRKAVREGETPAGGSLSFPMPKFKNLTDKQVDDIYAYLMTLPPKKHKVK